ncbi:hypothetical protein ACFQ05_41265 [Amycolatopsis umgeniensis]|uniref:Multisubunit Na+/H+ antiporter MnhB subunit n=1 Tax=Amycolatopsis umgeniensis TaxID=336628 RepID=A0A841ART3_9PSEU|nr:hypothetical protein [Amycolatopsis umgeniensis]MBB5851549.1 multisubunit Na+/H+ antiporter MnhB subunit [Amycolatopsis umgeniensis]
MVDRGSRTVLHRPLMILAAAMAVLGTIALGGLVFDDRSLVNAPIWLKPLKFTISVGLYAVTLAWLIGQLTRGRRLGWWLGTVFAVGLGMDMALLFWQIVVRGRTLHFNRETPADQWINNMVANGAFTGWAATAAIAVLLLFQRLPDRAMNSALRAGAALSVVGIGVAMLMFGPNEGQLAQFRSGERPSIVGAHAVGVPDGGPGLPVVGWSTVGGDLRIPHFVGIHAIQVLPLLAFGLLVLARRYPVLESDFVRRNLVRTASVGFAGLLALLTWQAQRGQSIVHPDFWTLAAGAGIIAVVAAGSALSLRAPRPMHQLT